LIKIVLVFGIKRESVIRAFTVRILTTVDVLSTEDADCISVVDPDSTRPVRIRILIFN